MCVAAAKGSHLMHAWKHAVDTYWAERESMHEYFWMDALFKNLMEWDPQFLRQWQQVPYMYAGIPTRAYPSNRPYHACVGGYHWMCKHQMPSMQLWREVGDWHL